MKKILLFLIIFIFGINISKAQTRAPVGEDWKLTEGEKNNMLARLHECGIFKPCHNNSQVIDRNNDEYKWIVATYGETSNVSIIEARYTDEDEDRYKRLRGITDSKKAKVKGYKTMIVKVEPKQSKGAMASTSYYDCYTICPPPEPCN